MKKGPPKNKWAKSGLKKKMGLGRGPAHLGPAISNSPSLEDFLDPPLAQQTSW